MSRTSMTAILSGLCRQIVEDLTGWPECRFRLDMLTALDVVEFEWEQQGGQQFGEARRLVELAISAFYDP
jgi:hypothetical protein